MERARATWTDQRLDDLSRRMDDGFARLDQDIRALRSDLIGHIDATGTRLDGRIDRLEARVDGRIDGLEDRVDRSQTMMVQLSAAGLITTLATLATVVLTRG
jgi:hypothetical protein